MKNYLYIISLIVLCSCAGSKAAKYLKQGNVLEKNFKTTIPFEYRNGLIVIKVQIEGETYDFILDTGASNILSKELNAKLGIQPLDSEDVGDVYGDTQRLEYTKINKIKIGGVNFLETVAAISDFNSVTSLSCLDVDGLIGSNLMRNAVWDFDFKKQTITITDTESNLKIPANHKESKFYIGYAGIPSITTKVNGMTVLNNMIDFGYNGGIVLPLKVFEKQKNKRIKKWVKSYGEGSTGLYGKKKNITSYDSKIDEIKIGNLTVKNRIVYSAPFMENIFGLGFFKNYRVILNWKIKRIKMVEVSPLKDELYLNYGFSYSYENSLIYVSALTENSNASKYLKIGDQIIAVNDKNYLNTALDKWCKILENGLFDENKNETIITIIRNGKKKTFQLEKEALFN